MRWPRAVYRRHREKDLTAEARVFYELNSYSDTFYALLDRQRENPDLLIDFGLDEESVVVDAGAYTGGWSKRVSVKSGAHLHAFEPSPAAMRRFRANLADRPNVTAYEYGLGAADAEMTLSVRGPGSTLELDSLAQGGQLTRSTVQIRDVAAVFSELFDHVDMLALNIEGAEYDVLDRLTETGWLPRIDVLLIQFHEWIPRSHRRREASRRALQRTHDEIWSYPWIWEAWRRRS